MTTVYVLYKTQEKLQDLLDVFREMEGIEVAGDSDNLERATAGITEGSPTMVLVEVGGGLEDHISFIEGMRHTVPGTVFLAFGDSPDSDIVIKAVNAGVKYFVKEPFEAASMRRLVERVWTEERFERARKPEDGKVLTVFSNKGGLGKTTVATNLAVSLSLNCKKSVALIDLDLQFGDISIFLDLHPTFTISDLVSRIRELDHELIRSSLIRHETGVHALTEPKLAEESDLITPDHVNKIVETMRTLFDFVIIDTTHSFDDVIIEAMEISDSILLISVLDLPTIRNTQRCLEIFQRLNFPEEKIKIIVNRFMSEGEVDPVRFESALKFPVFWKIPNDYSTVINAINGGIPLQRLAPSSSITKNFNELANELTGNAAGEKSNHLQGRMFKRVISLMSRSKNE